MMKKVSLLLFFACLSALSASAQMRTSGADYWYFGGSIGIANYFGDLAPKAGYGSTNLRFTRPSFSAFLGKKIHPQIALEGELAYQRLIASDYINADPRNVRHRYRYMRNANFKNDLIELNVRGVFEFIPSRGDYYRRPTYRPYAFLGIGVFYHNPKGKTPDGDWVALRPLRTEGQGLAEGPNAQAAGVDYRNKPYSLIQATIPFGLGLKYKLNDRMDLALEVGYRYLFTDYIDDVSGNYADAADLAAHNPLSVIMANRTLEAVDPMTGDARDFTVVDGTNGYTVDALGNPTVNGFGNVGDKRGESKDLDIYIVTAVKLHILLNTGIKCPKFR